MSQSKRKEYVEQARKLLELARKTAEVDYAWELVDLIYDQCLLDYIQVDSESGVIMTPKQNIKELKLDKT